MSKHQLIQHWPDPVVVRNISSLISFAIFYSAFISLFKTRVSRLRKITRLEPTATVKPHFNQSARTEWDDIKQALISDPCLARYDHTKHLYIHTYFSGKGFGYAACQPSNDVNSLAAMRCEMAGGPCEFMPKGSKIVLCCVAFGSRRTRGNENAFTLIWVKGSPAIGPSTSVAP